MRKRISFVLLVVALLVTIGVVTAQAANTTEVIIEEAEKLKGAFDGYTYDTGEVASTVDIPASEGIKCPVCGSAQKWYAINKGGSINGGGTKHYWIPEEEMTLTAGMYQGGGTAHVFLNDAKVTAATASVARAGATWYIFGDGEWINTGTGYTLYSNGGTFNIYGGTYTSSGANTGYIHDSNNATINLYRGTIDSVNLTSGKLNINGGSVTNVTTSGGTMTVAGGKVTTLNANGGTLTVSNGEIATLNDGVGAVVSGGAIANLNANSASLAVSGGEITTLISSAGAAVSGGKIANLTASGGTLTVSGGEVSALNATAGEVAVSNGAVTNATVTGATLSLSGTPKITTLDLNGAQTLPISVADLAEGAAIGIDVDLGTTVAANMTAEDEAYFSYIDPTGMNKLGVDDSGNLVAVAKTFDTPKEIAEYAENYMDFGYLTGEALDNAVNASSPTYSAFCPVCKATKSWAPIIKSGSVNGGGNLKHRYIAVEDLTLTKRIEAAANVHINLNGATITSSVNYGMFYSDNGADFGIMGEGTVIHNGNAGATDSMFDLNTSGGIITVYGGTYQASDTTFAVVNARCGNTQFTSYYADLTGAVVSKSVDDTTVTFGEGTVLNGKILPVGASTINSDVVAALDMNGQTGVTIGGTGAISISDSVNKETVNTTGQYGKATVTNPNAVAADSFIALAEDDGTVGFHYYETELKGVALKAPDDKVGLYYTGAWTMDSTLKEVAKAGVVVSLAKLPTTSFYSEYEESVANGTKHENFFYGYDANTLTNGTAYNSVLVNGILKSSRDAEANDTAGQTKIYATAYIQIPKQGTIVVSAPREDGLDQLSVYDALAKIDAKGAADLTDIYANWEKYSNIKKIVASLNGKFLPVLRFAVASDVHIRTDGAFQSYDQLSNLVSTAYAYTDNSTMYNKLDGMFFLGDNTNDGEADQQTYFFDYIENNTREETVTRAILGNHEFYAAGGYTTESFAQTPIDFMSYSGYDSVDTHLVIGGYHFIFLSMDNYNKGQNKYFGAEKLAWLETELNNAVADDPNKAIFVFQHEPPYDTSIASADSGADKNLRTLLNNYPQVIDFSGHKHANITDPRCIWQGEFTALNCGGMAYVSMSYPGDATYDEAGLKAVDNEGGWITGDFENGPRTGVFYYIVEINAEGVVQILRCNSLTGEIEGEPFIIDSFDPADFKYTDARSEQAVKPEFAEDAALTALSKNAVKTIIKIPQATCKDGVQGYRVDTYKGESLVSSVYRVSNSCYGSLTPAFVKAYIDDLEPATDYTIKVFAISSYAKESDPLVLNITTNALGENPVADILDVTFNSDGTATNAVTGETLDVYGEPGVTYDETVQMNVGTFDGDDAFSDPTIRNWYSNLAEGFTMEAYAYVGSKPIGGNHQAILSNQQSGGIALVYRDDGTLRLSIFDDDTGWVYASTPDKVTANSWYHIVGVFDGTDMRLYVNGEMVDEVLGAGPLRNIKDGSNNAQFMCVGSDSGAGKIDYPYKGKIATAKIYSEVLTDTQIAALYNDIVS